MNPCSEHAKCINTQSSYICQCNQGYSGDGYTCHDINECNMNPGKICGNHSSCFNTEGSYDCQCEPGFTGNSTCTDINECTTNERNCSIHSHCVNTIGSSYCRCNDGYYGDGIACHPILICSGNNNCNYNANCMIYNKTQYYCSCKIGYYSNSQLPETQLQSGSHCQRGQVYTGSLQIAGIFNQELNNTHSTSYHALQQAVTNTLTLTLKLSSITKSKFERVAVTGFKAGSIIAEYYIIFKQDANINITELTNIISTSNYTIQGKPMQNVTVNDYDECANKTDNICTLNQNCINLPGSYTCQCKPGFTGSSCVDINECSAPQACGNNTICSDTVGSYICRCQNGYHGDPYSNTGCVGACTPGFCLNGGTCTTVHIGQNCSCTKEFTGTRCDTRILQIPAIIGISVGAVAAIIIFVAIPLLYYFSRRARRRKGNRLARAGTSLLFDDANDQLNLNANIELLSPSQ